MRQHSSISIRSIAAAAVLSKPSMSTPQRCAFRGNGRTTGRWQQRSFSERPLIGNQIIGRDSHFESVRDANTQFQGGGSYGASYRRDQGNIGGNYQPLFCSHSPRPRGVPSPQVRPHMNRNWYRNGNGAQFGGNQGYRPAQQLRPERTKPLDYREWENAKLRPPPDCERISVLSYNILADYLANEHRNKLYYHIPRRFLDWEWRKGNIVFELGLWSPDVMCFQEVDRFDDLEDALKPRGYAGIWKMRTGVPTDGCAIFWRATKFKLIHEECIEFNRLGLRDNVAQICVLESVIQDGTKCQSNTPRSSSAQTRVIICNIHVLYNPKRGEIKLGQVRALLDRAYAVSKDWSDAPVVLCGDFNCTPQSPLYKFISEQKLDISEVERDKVSGQASAEIRNERKQYDPQPWVRSSNVEGPSSSISENQNTDPEQSNSSSDVRNNNSESNLELSSSVLVDGEEVVTDLSEILSDTQQPSFSTGSSVSISLKNLDNSHLAQPAASMPSVDKGVNEKETNSYAKLNISATSTTENPSSGRVEGDLELQADVVSDIKIELSAPPSLSDIYSESEGMKCESSSKAHDCSSKDGNSTGLVEVLADLSLDARDKTEKVDEKSGKSSESFLPESHDPEDSPADGNLQHISSSTDAASVAGYTNEYNASLWTPMDIATATGNENCTVLNHSLKLQSTYTEVEDCFGTRDSNGEPLVTSYNRCFLGTVDYIWRSEGLRTVKVLAPMPVHAMKWTPGFPTKKWGSDHIAIVAELAFTEHIQVEDSEAL
ncbi:Carbon catabolite repressor protein 4 homolog 6-like protein [Drosera capensis]